MQLAVDVRRASTPARPTSCAGRWAPNGRRAKMEQAARPVLRRHARSCTASPATLADRIYERLLAFANFGFAEIHALSLRLAGVLLVLAQAAPPGRVLRGAAARPADGLLLAAVAGGRRPPARGDGAPARTSTPPVAHADLDPDRTANRRSGSGLAGSAPSATSSPSRSSTDRKADGSVDAGRADQGGHADQRRRPRRWPPPVRWRLTASGIEPDRRRALWAAGAAAGHARPAPWRRRRRPGRARAARDERDRADRRRHLGHRHLAGDLSDPVLPGDSSSEWGCAPPTGLQSVPHGTRVLVAGAVTHRQRPATAPGVIFINLEDETGMVNVICSVGPVGPLPADRPGVAGAVDPRGGRTRRRGDLGRGRPDRRGESHRRHALAGLPMTAGLARSGT